MRSPDRGPEPRMQKIQTSKHGYSGLARVRSAGELVVALDQNNLPFSSAHPEPAGLDYEIAGLLARATGCPAPRLLGHLRARFLPVETVVQRTVRRDSGGHARRSVRAAGSLFPALSTRRAINWSSASGEGPPSVGRARGRRGRGRCPRVGRAAGTAVSQHRSDSGSRRDRPGESGLRDLDTGCLAGPEALAGKARLPPAAGIVGPLSSLRGRAKNDGDLKDAIDRAWDELDRSGQLARRLLAGTFLTIRRGW